MSTNPFLDPEYPIDYDLKGKDVKTVRSTSHQLRGKKLDTRGGSKPGSFTLEELTDCYRVGGLQFPDKERQLDLAKELLEGGASKTQDYWSAYTKEALTENKFGVGAAPIYHAIFSTLYSHRNDTNHKAMIEKIRAFLQATFATSWVNTLSRVVYEPTGKDKVIHHKGLPSETSISETIAGPDVYLKDDPASAVACKALILDDDLKQINDVYKWISGKDTYLWRVNNKPESKTERVVALGVYGVGFDLSAGVMGYWPALGVRPARKISTGNKGAP